MKSAFIRNLIILAILFFITYALADGINQYNALSIFLALASLGALCVGIYLFSRLQAVEEEE